MTDLLRKLGQKSSAEGTESTASSQTDKTGNIPPLHATSQNRGDNLLHQAGKASESTSVDGPSAEVKSQVTGEESPVAVVTDPDSWTKDSALKEMKKAREEAKANRLKYEESVQRLKDDAEARIAAVKLEQEELRKAAQELSKLKEEEEDKKRDLHAKVAHRDAEVAKLRADIDVKDRTFREEQERIKTKLERYEAEAQAQIKVYEQRVASELESVPEKFKEIANLLVKGAGDPREALVALNEAKLKGLFEEKTVVVNHSVPGAAQGARATQEGLDEKAKEARAKLSSQQKIGQALKNMRKGESNSAFRIR